jgi:hypothetical protein
MRGTNVISAKLLLGTLWLALLSGCASTNPQLETAQEDIRLSPEEKALRAAVTRQRVAEGAAQGCISTGAGSALLGLIGGASPRQILENAAHGCLVGGIVGAAAGYYVDARAQEYANDQLRLNAMANAAEKDVARYDELISATRNLIRQEKRRINALEGQTQAAQAEIRSREQRLAVQRKNVALLEGQLDEIDGNIQTIASDRKALEKKGVDTTRLAAKQNSLEQKKKDIERQVAQLKSLYKDTA